MNSNLFQVDTLAPGTSGRILAHVLAILVLAVSAHLLVLLVRLASDWLIRKSAARATPMGFITQQPKFITLTGLVASALTFAIYFGALGFILREFQVNLTAYLATASVIGLAVGFGSQGLVQDVVTGLTLIFSDTLDVGDVIEVSGQIGRVERVGLRFTQLTNVYQQQVFVPNRMIANIARFPAGGIWAYADVQIPGRADRQQVLEAIQFVARSTALQHSGVILTEPDFSEPQTAGSAAWQFVRVRFKIWPGQNSVIEITFRQRMLHAMKTFDPEYADWMIAVTYRAQFVESTEKP